MNSVKRTSAGAITRVLKSAGLRRRRMGSSIGFASWQREDHVSVHIYDPYGQSPDAVNMFEQAVSVLKEKGYVFEGKQTTRDRAIITVHGRRAQ